MVGFVHLLERSNNNNNPRIAFGFNLLGEKAPYAGPVAFAITAF